MYHRVCRRTNMRRVVQISPQVPRECKDIFMGVAMEISVTCRCMFLLFGVRNICARKANQSVFMSINNSLLPLFSCCVKWWEKKYLATVETGDVERTQAWPQASVPYMSVESICYHCSIVCLLCASLSWGKHILISLLSAFGFIVWLQLNRSQLRIEAICMSRSDDSTDVKIQPINPKDPGSFAKPLWFSLTSQPVGSLPSHHLCPSQVWSTLETN